MAVDLLVLILAMTPGVDSCGFSVTPIEDRGLRPSGCLFGGSFSITPIEDRGFDLSGCLLPSIVIGAEVHFQ